MTQSFNNADVSREHYQWNMDVWGVGGVEAEAELLSAIVASWRSSSKSHYGIFGSMDRIW